MIPFPFPPPVPDPAPEDDPVLRRTPPSRASLIGFRLIMGVLTLVIVLMLLAMALLLLFLHGLSSGAEQTRKHDESQRAEELAENRRTAATVGQRLTAAVADGDLAESEIEAAVSTEYLLNSSPQDVTVRTRFLGDGSTCFVYTVAKPLTRTSTVKVTELSLLDCSFLDFPVRETASAASADEKD